MPRRKIRYVDQALQRRLLFVLVASEVLLVSVGLWVLYGHLSEVVNQNLYRVHQSGSQPMFTLLLRETLVMLAGLVAANLVLLVIADRLWAGYVNSILRPFSELIARTGVLDFKEDAPPARQHPVLDLARDWRVRERVRYQAVRNEIMSIDVGADFSSPEERERSLAALQRLRQLLP